MKVNNINQINFGAGIKIYSKENKGIIYLYNYANDIIKEYRVPAIFHSYEIELPQATKDILKKSTNSELSTT